MAHTSSNNQLAKNVEQIELYFQLKYEYLLS